MSQPPSADSAPAPIVDGSILAAALESPSADLATPAPPAEQAQPRTPETVADALASAFGPEGQPEATSVGAPAATTPTALSVDALAPEARRFLEMRGWKAGDPLTNEIVSKALTDGLQYNNRLAELSKPQAPPAEVAPVAPPPPDPQQVENYVRQQLDRDVEAIQYVQTFHQHDAQIKAIDAEVPALEKQLQIAKLRSEIPEIKADQYAFQGLRDEIRTLTEDIRDRRYQRREAEAEKARVNGLYTSKADQIRQGVSQHLSNQQAEALKAKTFTQSVQSHRDALSTAWQPTLDQVLRDNGIPADQKSDFETIAKREALANLETGLPVENLHGFLDKVAKDELARMDRYHRLRSGQYAQQANARVANATPGPVGAAAVGARPPTRPSTDPLADIMNRAAERVRRDLMGQV